MVYLKIYADHIKLVYNGSEIAMGTVLHVRPEYFNKPLTLKVPVGIYKEFREPDPEASELIVEYLNTQKKYENLKPLTTPGKAYSIDLPVMITGAGRFNINIIFKYRYKLYGSWHETADAITVTMIGEQPVAPPTPQPPVQPTPTPPPEEGGREERRELFGEYSLPLMIGLGALALTLTIGGVILLVKS